MDILETDTGIAVSTMEVEPVTGNDTENNSTVLPCEYDALPSCMEGATKEQNVMSLSSTESCGATNNETISDAKKNHSLEQLDPTEDVYAYTKTERFTSEVFKIEISNLPNFLGYGECKKLLTKKLKLKPHKINVVSRIHKAYVTFKNEEEKKEAMDKLHNYEHKGKKFQVKNAKPKKDAMAVKRKHSDNANAEGHKRQMIDDESISIEDLLKNSVIPWWKTPYMNQLEEKYQKICSSLTNLRKRISDIDNLDREVFVWLMQQKGKTGLCCPTKPILPSPVTTEYRNKCGFTVGKNINGEPEVGFRLGKYRDKICAVAPPTCLSHVPEVMKKIAACFALYVRQSKLEVYEKQTYAGYWRQLTVRTTRNNNAMATIALSQQKLTDADLKEERDAVRNHFLSNGISLDTLLFRIITAQGHSNAEDTPAEIEHGEGVIFEPLFELKIRVSPDAFFQCNTLGAEILYSCVKDMVLKSVKNETEFSEPENCKDVILLDICCGTGTIGLCLASSVKRVIGVDICKGAIEDAKINAKINNINNVEFRCNKAEEELPSLVRNLSSCANNVVAVVDPPRCGLHNKVIKAIRQCSSIKKLVYVSCSVDQARNNFIDLCRPASKRLIGDAFLPVLAQPMDLFPHTAHCEVVLLFERIKKVIPEPDNNLGVKPLPETASVDVKKEIPIVSPDVIKNVAAEESNATKPLVDEA